MRRIKGLRLMRSPTWKRPSSSRLSSSTTLKSRKVSAPPMMRPPSSLSKAVETLTGMRRPSPSTMKAERLMTGAPVRMVFLTAHSVSHMLARKTSEHGRPMASRRGIPVISSAARLNEVMRQAASTVNTPSEMLSRIAAVGASIIGVVADFFLIPFCAPYIPRLRSAMQAGRSMADMPGRCRLVRSGHDRPTSVFWPLKISRPCPRVGQKGSLWTIRSAKPASPCSP